MEIKVCTEKYDGVECISIQKKDEKYDFYTPMFSMPLVPGCGDRIGELLRVYTKEFGAVIAQEVA